MSEQEHSLRVLELPKVLEMAARHAWWERSKQAVLALRPLPTLADVRLRQAETAEAMRLDAAFQTPPIRGMRDVVPQAEAAARGQVLEPTDLLDVARALEIAGKVRKSLRERSDECPLLAQRAAALVAVPQLVERVHLCFTSDGQIKDSASPRLSDIRIQIRTLQNRIESKMQSVLRNPAYTRMFQEPYVTVRLERYVVPIKAECRAQFPGLVLDASASGATVFMEPMSVVDADNELRERRVAEKTEIERILTDLSRQVADARQIITDNGDVLAALDMLMAVARFAVEQHSILPPLEEKARLRLVLARHPLLGERAVPIDVELGGDRRVLVITGPNTGGKTVTLKTMGLLTAMAMCGLPLTCGEGSRVGFFGGVYADIGDEQDIQQNLSTFSSHVGQIARMLPLAEDGTLVLLDEAGAGTDPREGTSLAVAILEHLFARGALVVTTTHYNELKAFAAHFAGASNAAMEFDPDSLRPTYRILMGVPGRSCALEICQRLGVPQSVLQRATELLGTAHFAVEELLTQLEDERLQAARHGQEVREASAEATELRERLASEMRQLERSRARLRAQAAQEATQLVESARAEVRKLLDEVRSRAPEEPLEDIEQQAEERLDAVVETLEPVMEEPVPEPEEEKPREFLKGPVQKGDAVFVARVGQEGLVEEVSHGGQVEVSIGRMRMTLPMDQVQKVRQRKRSRAAAPEWEWAAASPSASVSRKAAASLRLDLRGQRAEDAAYLLSGYLDEVGPLGVGPVTIVHGKGGGVLLHVVHEQLGQHPAVASYRLGEDGEGGWGVTVVTFK